MTSWQTLPCELKLQIFRHLIHSVMQTSPQWPFAPEPSYTILHGIDNVLLVAPELRSHTVELIEKMLIVDIKDFGQGEEYRLLPIELLGPMWCWRDSKEKVEQLKQEILKEVKQEKKRQARYVRRMEKRTALRIAAMEAEHLTYLEDL